MFIGEVRRVTVSYCNGEHEAILDEDDGDHALLTCEQYEKLCEKAGVEPEYPEPLDY